ncbi:MAG TPA: class I SAM-dependent methyltransferase [Thermoanaerobaculia bacterium]|nr:class I SAM-dependent methyltransferase [Thermoanaerobaculia bacterium]
MPLPKLVRRALAVLRPRWHMQEAFTRHYRQNGWGDPESVSGPGSTLERTTTIRQELPPLFREFSIRSVLDAGCGDFNWFSTLEITLDHYIGTEVVRELVAANEKRHGSPTRRFVALDITRDCLPRMDLIFARDCLVHLKNAQIFAALRNFRRSGSRYLLTTTFTGEHPNADVPLGGWRPLNLERPPFSLPPPLRLVSEKRTVEDGRYIDKSLGLWGIEQLP